VRRMCFKLSRMEPLPKLRVVVGPTGWSWYDPIWGEEARELATELEQDDREISLQLPDPRVSYSMSQTWANLAIFIGGSVSATLLPLIVSDVYEGAKAFLRKRFARSENASEIRVTIYGPDHKPLKSIVMEDTGIIEDRPGDGRYSS
jgi:hypothetical protein